MKKLYCIECGAKICYTNWLYGSKKCISCSHKKLNITKDILIKAYNINKKSITCIAKELKCNYVSVYNYLKKYNIKIRTRRETHLGKKRPDQSKRMSGENNPIFGTIRSQVVRDKISKTRIERNYTGRRSARFGKISNNKCGYGKGSYYKNIWMRSTWEVKYAKYLDKNKIKWLYESKTFDLGNTTYTPDFYLPKTDEYIEIKGWWLKGAIDKFKVFKQLYKNIKTIVLMEKELKQLEVL